MSRYSGVVLVGEPGSGKSSIGAEITRLTGWPRASFAAPLKDEVATLLSRTEPAAFWTRVRSAVRAEMDDPATKDKYRAILQWYGTDWRRAADEDYWVRKMGNVLRGAPGHVIDDCRFTNERDMLEARGFAFVWLEAGATTRPLEGAQASHASEQDWPTWQVDLTLSYEEGVTKQALRITEALGLPVRPEEAV